MSTNTLSLRSAQLISTQLVHLFFAQFHSNPTQATGRALNVSPLGSGAGKVGNLVGNPSYKVLANGKVSVLIPYYCSYCDPRSQEALLLSPQKTQALGAALLQVLQVEGVEIRVIKLRYPYLDRAILAKYTALNAGKYPFARIHKTVFKKRAFFLLPTGDKTFSLFNDNLPYSSKGLKLELAGRLTTQQSIPRKTVANKHIGSGFSAPLKSRSRNQVKGHFRYASKNKLGAFTMKV